MKIISLSLLAAVLLTAFSSVTLADEIDQRCRSEWGANYEMVNYCTKNQRQAKREISGYSGLIRSNCEKEWGTNYEMVLYCIRNQSAAKAAVDSTPKDEISRMCTNEWGNNFEMVEYCIKNQRSAKQTIKQSYSGYKRQACERKWGSNYEMVLYCIRTKSDTEGTSPTIQPRSSIPTTPNYGSATVNVPKGVQALYPGTPYLYLGAIVYFGPESWSIWLNRQRINPRTRLNGIEVVSVEPDAAQLRITLADQEPAIIRLELRQAYVFATGRVVNGIP